jgi:hypothetical protein
MNLCLHGLLQEAATLFINDTCDFSYNHFCRRKNIITSLLLPISFINIQYTCFCKCERVIYVGLVALLLYSNKVASNKIWHTMWPQTLSWKVTFRSTYKGVWKWHWAVSDSYVDKHNWDADLLTYNRQASYMGSLCSVRALDPWHVQAAQPQHCACQEATGKLSATFHISVDKHLIW